MTTNPLSLIDTIMAMPGYPRASGMRVVLAEPGRVTLALSKRPELLQFAGHFHGGVITGLADQAAGAAVSSMLPKGRIAVTVELKVNYLTPADGEEIIARAEAMQAGNTIGVAKIEVISQNKGVERMCAFGIATMRAVDLPAKINDPDRD
ncbi:PaaI family thioesterase [Bradyrhizobium sp. 2TAF24]